MQVVISGIHQRMTPVALRERLAFNDLQLAAALQALGRETHEAFIISTCNRVEMYALIEDHADPTRIGEFLAAFHHIDSSELVPHLYTAVGEDAVRHLFRLAAGLDSMVLGEDQILGQIRNAMNTATEVGTLGPNLRRLCDSALTAGKLVRTKTGIARLNLSVVSVAIDLARQTLGSLHSQRVLIIGAGRMAELAIKHLHGEAPTLRVTNRTDSRAKLLAQRYGVQAAPFANLAALVRESDVVISCTASTETIINTDMLANPAERTTPLVLLDLAVPRDIQPDVAAIKHVKLFDVDCMQAICAANRVARTAEVEVAEALVHSEVVKFADWWAAQRVVPTIRALRERAEEIRAAELERTLARLSHLDPNDRAVIGALSAAIVNKLLHSPIVTLKNPRDSDELAQAVQRLFQL